MTSVAAARRRRRGGAVVACGVAIAALVALGFGVAAHMSGSSHHSMAGALTRAGSEPAGSLLSGKLLTDWQLDAIALALLVVITAWYLTAVALVAVRNPGARWPIERTLAFLAGIAVCAYATCGAIAVFDQALFTAHMAGHLALVMLAPALLVAGRPLRLAIESSPPARATRLRAIVGGRVIAAITCPPIALATYTVVIVGSHLTGLMDTIMRNTWIGQIEHLVYLLAGIQFFILVVGDEPIRWRLGAPARWLLLALAMAVDTFTGIVLMQGTNAVHMLPVASVDVDPLSDTRTGGSIMWFGGDGIMAVVMVALVIGWLRRVDTTVDERKGWLEQARIATFAAHTRTGPVERPADEGPTSSDLDSDDSARESYNTWLARLDKH